MKATDFLDSADDAGGNQSAESFLDAPEPKKRNKGLAGDLVTDAKRGGMSIPGMLTGIADIPVAAITGKPMISKGWDLVGEKTGFQPSKWAKEAEAEYSPAREEANRRTDEAWDNGTAMDIAGAYLSNPGHKILGPVVESLPSMAAGGVAARGIAAASKIAPVVAGAIGEGSVMAGQQMNNLTEEGVDGRTAAGAAALTGIAGGAIGAMGGKLAQRLGVVDPETALAGGAARAVAGEAGEKTLAQTIKEGAKRVAGGAASEGLFEELPQSVLEQVLSNLAQGKQWSEGVARSAVEGTLAGSLMGGAFNVLPGKPAEAATKPPAPEEKPEISGLLPAPVNQGTPGEQIVAADMQRQADIDAADANAAKIQKERDEYEQWQAELRRKNITIVNDPAPLQERIDALLGINEARLQGFARSNYEKALENAFAEQIGFVVGKDGLEVPFTMGDYMRSKVAAADADRKAAGQPAPSAGIASATAIPVVGPLSAAANSAVQSGASQVTAMQQAAAQAAENTSPKGKADTPAGVQPKPAAPAQGPITEAAGIAAPNTAPAAPSIAQPAPNTQPQGEGGTPATAQQAGPAAASPAGGEFDVSKRTDKQLEYLSVNGQPGWKEAAVAELQKRGVQVSAPQQAKTDEVSAAPKAKQDKPAAPVEVNADEDENAPTYGGKYDQVFKGNVPSGFSLVGKNTGGNNVYEAGGIRVVEDGEYFVRELAHKPKQDRYAEFKTADEIAKLRGDVSPVNDGDTKQAAETKAEKPLKSPTEGGPEDSIGWTRMTTAERTRLLIGAGYAGRGKQALNLGGAGALNRAWEAMGKGIREKLIAAHDAQFKPADQSPIKNEKPAAKPAASDGAEQNQEPIKKTSATGPLRITENADMGQFTVRAVAGDSMGTFQIKDGKATNIKARAQWALDDVRAAADEYAAGQSQQKTDAAPEARQDKAPASDAESRFAKNTIFTADKVAAAKARMKAKLGTLNSGIDPELLIDGMTVAGAYIESGVRKFADYAKAMVDDLGDGVKPYLLSFYEAARAYPGLNKMGMDSAESAAAQHQALLTPEVKVAAKEVIGEVPAVEKKKPANLGEAVRLKADWGVPNIDGYTRSKTGKNQDTDYGLKGGIKDEFLADASRYLKAVAKLLEAQGFTAQNDSKGKPFKVVSIGEGGPAVGGDVYLRMSKGGFEAFAQVGVTNVRGIGPAHPQGVSLMTRAGERMGMNNWLATDLSAGDLAAWFDKQYQAYERRGAGVAIPEASAKLEVKNEQPAATPATGEANDGTQTGKQGNPALEGVAAESVQGAAGSQSTGDGGGDGGRVRGEGNPRTDAGRGTPGRSGGSGSAEVDSAAAGGTGSGGTGLGSGRAGGQGSRVSTPAS